jgi:hypothetical protein
MPRAGFEPAIPASERPQTHVFDCAATGIGSTPEVLGGKPVLVVICAQQILHGQGLRWCQLSGEIPLSEYAKTPARFERFANRIHVENAIAVRASSDQATS